MKRNKIFAIVVLLLATLISAYQDQIVQSVTAQTPRQCYSFETSYFTCEFPNEEGGTCTSDYESNQFSSGNGRDSLDFQNVSCSGCSGSVYAPVAVNDGNCDDDLPCSGIGEICNNDTQCCRPLGCRFGTCE